MDTNKMREQFEAAYVDEMALCCGDGIRQRARANLEWRQENGDYRDPMVRLAYWAWQASREAVVVGLPPRKSIDHYCYDQGANCNAEGHNQCLTQVAAAIEAQGLKVSP